MTTDTIFALSSGAGRAGVGIIRISGAQASHVALALSFKLPAPREAAIAKLFDMEAELLDQALLLWFPAPHSFTGEDVLELHVHGSPAVVKAILRELATIDGCRPAEAGEFTRRAFVNGKKDLTEIEGLSDLLNADTEMQRRFALREAMGAHRALYEQWRGELLQAMALTEALIDFSADEDIPDSALAQAFARISTVRDDIAEHVAKSASAEILRDGLSVVIAGPPNAGKSSLLNALARRDVAIVNAAPGTTRDVLEVKLDLQGYPLTLIDTAGLRDADNDIEREGIRRAQARIENADLVLWLQSADEEATAPQHHTAQKTTWLLQTKSDLYPQLQTQPHSFEKTLLLSAKTGAGVETLLNALVEFAQAQFQIGTDSSLFLRERQRALLLQTLDALNAAQADMLLEILAEHLREAATALGKLTGLIGSEEILGEIFKAFCIGK